MVTGWQVGKHVNLESLSHGYRMAGRRTCKPGEYISWLQDKRYENMETWAAYIMFTELQGPSLQYLTKYKARYVVCTTLNRVIFLTNYRFKNYFNERLSRNSSLYCWIIDIAICRIIEEVIFKSCPTPLGKKQRSCPEDQMKPRERVEKIINDLFEFGVPVELLFDVDDLLKSNNIPKVMQDAFICPILQIQQIRQLLNKLFFGIASTLIGYTFRYSF